MVMKKNIDPAVRKQIEDALQSGRIDSFLVLGLDDILSENDASFLEKKISFFAIGNPTTIPQGMNKLTEGTYTGHGTYKSLVDYVHLCDEKGNPLFSYFEASVKLSPH